MTKARDKTASKLRIRGRRSADSLTNILSQPDQISEGDWSSLQPPRPRDAEEKKALEKELVLGGRKVTVLQVRTQLLIELMDSTALRLLLAINDEERIEKATVQQLSIAFGTIVDKSRLLKGEPTAIYRHEDIRKLDELGAALMKEMQRRGITVDGELEDTT